MIVMKELQGSALLFNKTISYGHSQGNSKYDKRFDTSHVLAYMLVGNVADETELDIPGVKTGFNPFI
ncbi:Uncharacterised protein [Streptococcus uberis]|uniref:hypothetical protein n=1 Tax=Streptococcus uberis TaxID=1349 RepID=UPI000DA32BB0|nr:hypothetical protein [Streptococcus uberis]SQG82245.1 Uncharacterised protein [Streptococcus uberis]